MFPLSDPGHHPAILNKLSHEKLDLSVMHFEIPKTRRTDKKDIW